MNHPSEWARYFDENTGSYRYKHKGSGVIRDTFMTIGKVFKNNVKNVAKKTAETNTKNTARAKKQKPLSQDAKKKPKTKKNQTLL